MKTIRLHIFKQHFTFSVSSFLWGLPILMLLLSLSVWQWHRADEKKALIQDYRRWMHAKPLLPDQVRHNYSAVKAYGHYENDKTVFLDNQIQAHQVGYAVLTPFILEGTQQRLIVNRGWVKRGVSRSSLPSVEPVQGRFYLSGLAYFIKKPGFVIGKQHEGVALIQQLDLKKLASGFPFIVLLDPEAQGGFIRNWRLNVAVTPAKHMGYAVQWLLLALTFLVLFMVVHRKK